MSRGDQRDDIFLDDVDRRDFIKILAEACQEANWQVHAFCLMRNHYHLVVDRLLGEQGVQQDTPAGRQEFERHRERRRVEEVEKEALEEFQQAWIIGGEAFRKECWEQMEGQVGSNHPGKLRLETAEAKAERLIAKEFARHKWTEQDLAAQRKSHPLKLARAARLRPENALSVRRIAERLRLGRPEGARANLHKWLKKPNTGNPQIQSGIQWTVHETMRFYGLTPRLSRQHVPNHL